MTANYGAQEIAEVLRGGKKMGFTPHLLASAHSDDDDDVLDADFYKRFASVQESREDSSIDQQIYKQAMEALKEDVDAPLLGRIDYVAVYREIADKEYYAVFDREMEKKIRGFTKFFPLNFIVYQEVKAYIIYRCLKYKDLGARRLKTLINQEIFSGLAKAKNRGEIRVGDTIVVKLENTDDLKRVSKKVGVRLYVLGPSKDSQKQLLLPYAVI